MRSTRGSWRGRKIYSSRRQLLHWRRLPKVAARYVSQRGALGGATPLSL